MSDPCTATATAPTSTPAGASDSAPITNPMLRQQLVREASVLVAGRWHLSCTAALALANRFGCSPAEVGRIAEREAIKISGCQLGCF